METLYFDVFSLSIDIDECTTNPCDANAVCLNTNGSFDCTCRPGFDGDGKVCKGKKSVTCERVGDILYFKRSSHVCEEHFSFPAQLLKFHLISRRLRPRVTSAKRRLP